MKKVLNSRYFVPVVFVIVAFTWYKIHQADRHNKRYKCETKKLDIRGVITKKAGRGGYESILVNNDTNWLSFNVSADAKYRKGFGKYHYDEVGDSIIKKAGSDEVIIKNGDSICILTIDCGE